MRLHFSLSPNREPVNFNTQHKLAGVLHRWLGSNNLFHDSLSLYSLGTVQGGFAQNGALQFPCGATWFISAPDTPVGQEFLKHIAFASQNDRSVCHGMEVIEIHCENTPEFGHKRVFRAGSPVFIRGEKQDGKDPHILFDSPDADDYLTATLHRKLEVAGLSHLSEGSFMCFDRSYKAAKAKLIWIKEGFDKNGQRRDFQKKASVCPVIVEGHPEVVKFAFNTGAGNLTGMGFGSLV